MPTLVDINCDMGEADTVEALRQDERLMPFISRCNIAVGGHVGNAQTIIHSFNKAKQQGLFVGLHPSYPDRKHFGRKRLTKHWHDLALSLEQQINLGLECAEQCAVAISHIKCHGMLYNDLETDLELATNLSQLLKTYQLPVMGMSGGQFQRQCEAVELDYIPEAFADRAYKSPTELQPRNKAGALIEDPILAAQQALNLAVGAPIQSAHGDPIQITARSICVHSDTPNSMDILVRISNEIDRHGMLLAKQSME